jgi:hypothetical protein
MLLLINMNNIKSISQVVIVGVVAFIAGYFVPHSSSDLKLREAKEFFKIPPTSMVAGRIVSIDGNNIKIRNINRNPLIEQQEIIEVVVTDATRFDRLVTKSEEDMAKDLAEYKIRVAGAASISGLIPPAPIRRESTSLSELKVDRYIEVSTKVPVENEASIEAVQITESNRVVVTP